MEFDPSTSPTCTFYAVEAPSELEHVARKALQKEREARHQTVGELLNDLKEIKQELEFQAKLERSAQPAAVKPKSLVAVRSIVVSLIRKLKLSSNLGIYF